MILIYTFSFNTYFQHTYNQHHLSFTIFYHRSIVISMLAPSVGHTIITVCSRNMLKQKPQQNSNRCTFSNPSLFMLLLYHTQGNNLSFIVEIGGLGIVKRHLRNMRPPTNLSDVNASMTGKISRTGDHCSTPS